MSKPHDLQFSLFSIKSGVVVRKYFPVNFSRRKAAMTKCHLTYCFETHQRKIMLCGTSNSSMQHCTPFSLQLQWAMQVFSQAASVRINLQKSRDSQHVLYQWFDPVDYLSAQLISSSWRDGSPQKWKLTHHLLTTMRMEGCWPSGAAFAFLGWTLPGSFNGIIENLSS